MPWMHRGWQASGAADPRDPGSPGRAGSHVVQTALCPENQGFVKIKGGVDCGDEDCQIGMLTV